MWGRSVCPENAVQLFDPSFFGLLQPSLQSTENDPVGGLSLSVGLGVLDRSEVLLRPEFGYEFLEFSVRELGAVVGYYRLWYPESGEYVPLVKSEYVLGCDFSECLGLYPFCEIVHSDYQVFVLVGSDRERSEEVHPPCRERPWRRERFELVWWCQVHVGVTLAFVAF